MSKRTLHGTKCLSLEIAPFALLSFAATIPVWTFQLRCSSRWTPRYLTLLLGMLLGMRIFPKSLRRGIQSIRFQGDWKITNSVFLAFREILLALSQLTKILRSELTLPQRFQTVFEKFRRCVSSAKWNVSDLRMHLCCADHLYTTRTTEGPRLIPEEHHGLWV